MEAKPNTIYRALDRKAAAITEFTMRQYRTKASTWVVLGVVRGQFGVCRKIVFFLLIFAQSPLEIITSLGESVGDGLRGRCDPPVTLRT